MNELSTEVKAQEIHERAVGFYKISEQYGYKFLMEIKTIRDEKLFEELGFKNFEEYTLNNFNFSKRTINERLQDAESFGEEYERALASYGKHKAHQLATLPKRQRNNVLENGIETDKGNKTIDEATTREIEEYKKQLKQRDEEKSQLESQLEQAQRSESIARKQLEEAEDKEPEVKREVKEVIPPHVKAQLLDRQQMINAKDKEIEQLREQISKAEEQKQKFEKQDYLEDEEQIASMNFQVESTVLEIKDNINRFLNENSANAFKEAAIARASERTKNQIYDGIEELEAFCRTMRRSLDSNVIIGG
ncbi:hypothetical protein [Staphylococcus saprophyticus]|uniref:hypothetical protein n=1 Tax=Staphylococcus saprophyticus TaxID=29385 RepID=UPI0006599119|nr:hypothetical protein [Staphylococcus saprophyticus]MCT1652611.1 hypothetical protein [Staphylococcus saprophyticus]MDW3950112.1 hypothetical protein [Staphylococcus saprophyticus]MDW4145993.1 hypothetical protein [Staphylococcus saprophyticus]CRV22943.1 Uncharacterised protein [Streptococcus equi subsp. equi]